MQFRVRIIYDGVPSDPVVSNTVDYEVAFCADDFSTRYATDMDNSWSTTKSNASANHGTLYEIGFLGTFDGTSYGTASAPLVTSPCGTVADVTPSTTEYPTGGSPITGEVVTPWLVGKFHTHPPVQYCNTNVSYAQGPSCIDIGTCAPSGGVAVDPTSLPFPMVVRTYAGTAQYNSSGTITPLNAATVDTAYGNTCTQY